MSLTYDQAVNAITELQRNQPAEPFANLKRRPRHFRYSLEFRQWQTDLRNWQTQYAGLLRQGLQAITEPNAAGVSFYQDEITSARFERQPNGAIIRDCRSAENAHPLALPGPRQNPRNLQEYCRDLWLYGQQWNLAMKFRQYLTENGLHPNQSNGATITRDNAHIADPIMAEIADRVAQLELHLIRRAAALLLPEPVSLLRRTAPRIKPNLRHYNLAALASETLRQTAQTNPGAAAWFVFRYGEPGGRDTDKPLPDVPAHPGAIIAAVRAQFEAHGGQRWRMLAAQPARDIITQLASHSPSQTAFMADALADAAIPRLADPPAQARKQAKPQARQGTLFDSFPPVPEPPAPARYQQPPLALKTALIALCDRGAAGIVHNDRARRRLGLDAQRQRIQLADAGPLDHALLRFCRLAIRHYGTMPTPQGGHTAAQRTYITRMASVADFVHGQPETAGRCTTWNGLVKGSERWHRDENLRAIAEAEQRTAEADAKAQTPWQSAIETHQADGWHAHALLTAVDLSRETAVLKHCVGRGYYANQCRAGRSRIFRIEPDGIDPDDVSSQRQCATTLELGKDNAGWFIRQHQGYLNRKVTPLEATRANELLAVWNRTVRQQPAGV